MAEVKQTSGSFSLPLKKKPPSFNTHGASTSFKHIYDDVFGSSPSSNVKTSSSFMEDDYAEIFGSSKSNNGSWSIPYSSVPILELPRDKGVVFKGERVDYGGVFSSFDNGVGDYEGLPDGEELINQLKKKAKTSSLNNLPRSHGRSTEATKLESPSQSYDDQLPDNGFSQSFDNVKHPQPANDNVTEKAASRTRKATHIRVYSFHEPVIRDDLPNTYPSMGGKQANHCRHTSLDLGVQSCKTNTGLQKSSGISVTNTDTLNGTSQPSKAAINGFHESSDNTKNPENNLNETNDNKNREDIHTSEVHPIPEPTFSLREVRPTSDIKPNNESDHSLNEQDSTQETVFNKTSVLNEPQFTEDVNLMEEQKKHSRNTSLELSSKLNDNYDGVFQKPSGLTESMSAGNSHEACEASCASDPSHMVKDDVSVDSPKVKRKGRRSRMASVDLGDYKHSSERDDGLKRKPRFGGSYSFDASHDPCAARVRVHPSMMHPSSSLPRFFPVESHYKISENSTGKRSQMKWDGGASDSPPSLIEELDVNSDAAISAALLQKAIEEAELRIRMAKAFLEREGQGSTKRSFKDTLKVRVERENGVVNEVHKIKQTKLHDWCPPVVDSEQKEHCSTSDRKLHDCSPPVVDSQQNEQCSPLDRNHAGETTRRASIGEDVKKFIEDTNLADREDVKATNSITGDDKREGEWEAAKHINQIISGVKNKLASFISWQTETEKKDAVKEMEEIMKAQQQLEENEYDSKDRDTFKRKRTEQNEVTSTSSFEAAQGDKKPQFVSEPVKSENSEVNESVNSFKVKQDKPENRIDSNLVTTNLANFQFFAFRNQCICDSSEPKVEEIEPLETKESEMVNGQEQAIDEVEINLTPSVGEEASQEESDVKSVTEDSTRQDDTSQTHDAVLQNDKVDEKSCSSADHIIEKLSVEDLCQGKMIGKDEVCAISRENVEMVEEHCSMARNDNMEPSHEEDEQDYMSGNSCLSSVNEENDELVEQPSSFDDEKELPFEEDRQDGVYKFSHLSSGNEETEAMMEVCNQAGHERYGADHEVYNRSSTEKSGDEPTDHSYLSGDISLKTAEGKLDEMQEEAIYQHEKVKLLKESWKTFESSKGDHECQEEDSDQRETNHFEEPEQTYGGEDIKQVEEQNELIEETAEKVNVQEGSVASADEGCVLDDNVFLCETEEAHKIDGTSSEVEEVYWEEELERMDFSSTTEPQINVQSAGSVLKANGLLDEEIPASAPRSSELKEEASESIRKPVELIGEEPVTSSLYTETEMELEKNEIKDGVNGTIGDLEHENFVSLDRELDLSTCKKDADMKAMDHSESQYNMDDRTLYLHEDGENLHMGEDAAIDLDAERHSVEAFHRRRRWFDHGRTVSMAERPSILEGKGIELENTQEVLDESEIAGSVEIHADKLASDVTTARDADASSNPDIARTNVETTPTRKKWFVKEAKPEPVSLFEDIKVNLELPLERMNESGVAVDGEKGKQSGETAPRRRRWFESGERGGTNQQAKLEDDVGLNGKIDQESKAKVDEEQLGKHDGIPIPQEKNDVYEKEKPEKEYRKDLDEVHRRGKEREKERLAVERAIREARERAFAEAKERARRETTDRLNMEARPKVAAGVQEKLGKVSSEATSSSDKAFMEAKLKAERAAVERATAEARERALQKSLSEKGSHRSREPAGIYSFERNSSMESKNQSSRGSDSSNNNEKVEGSYVESPQRRKARLERQTRTMERATKALEEKNRRDLLAQKEQIAKNMMADSLDAEVKRWCTGKEGNLRALLSTLQYVLGPESGWQPVSLTDLVASTAVRKAYKKATLCVHPDKLQQRGASIQQKYICEKVFDLLKDAWSKFHPDER